MNYEVYMICPPWRQYRNYQRSQRWMMDNLPPKTLKAMKAFYFIRDCLEIGSSPNQMLFVWVTSKFTEDCQGIYEAVGVYLLQLSRLAKTSMEKGHDKNGIRIPDGFL